MRTKKLKMADKTHVKNLVVDSGGFLRHVDIRSITDNVFTCREVISEIKDAETRQRLQVLPYELSLRTPSQESIKAVTTFSKKSGEYTSLSAVDIRVIALTYELECEKVGKELVKILPTPEIEWESTKGNVSKLSNISGFYLEKGKQLADSGSNVGETEEPTTNEPTTNEPTTNEPTINEPITNEPTTNEPTTNEPNTDEPTTDRQTLTSSIRDVDGETKDEDLEQEIEAVTEQVNKVEISDEQVSSDDEGWSDEGESWGEHGVEEDEEEDEGGWINPSNLQQKRRDMQGFDDDLVTKEVEVACLTTDYAMQNVLIQMGLNVVSIAGLLIKRTHNFVKFCTSCEKNTGKRNIRFCPFCGNNNLRKMMVTMNKDGTKTYTMSDRPITSKGKKFTITPHKGGKHVINPILSADQRNMNQRSSAMSKKKYNVFDNDYIANSSPFAPNDVYSRSSMLGTKPNRNNFQHRNPAAPLAKGKKKH